MGQLSWVKQTILTNTSWDQLVCDSTNGIAIATAFTQSGAQRSADGGVTWTGLENTGGLPAVPFGGCGFGGGTFLISLGSNSHIYRSTDGGVTWTIETTNPGWASGNAKVTFAFSPTLGTGSGMWCAFAPTQFSTSTDGGNNWTAAATVTGSGSASRYPAVWDGTNFLVAQRDSGNANTCIFSSSNGSTWTTNTIQSIFATGGDIGCMNFTNGVYTVGFRTANRFRQATSVSGLASATPTDFGANWPGCSAIQGIAASPTGKMTVFLGGSNTVAGSIDSAEQTPAQATNFAFDTTPQGLNSSFVGVVYDAKHNTFITVGGGLNGSAATAQYAENPVVTVNPTSVVIPSGSGNQLFTTTSLNPPNVPIIWSVNGIVGGNPTIGTIVDGYYTAPRVPTIGSVTITATHAFSPTTQANAAITFVGHVPLPVNPISQVQNYTAPAGIGGGKWGAAGGGITPVGVSKPLAATFANAERPANYRPTVTPTIAPTTGSLAEQVSDAALDRQTSDSALGHGGTTQG